MTVEFKYMFARPSVTATVVLFHETSGQFLTGKRSKTTSAFPDTDSLPGGFLDPRIGAGDVAKSLINIFKPNEFKAMVKKMIRPGETAEQAAVREIKEETNLKISEDRLVQFYTCSDPELDPRCHVVNVCFYVVVNELDLISLQAGDDLQSVEWVDNDVLSEPSYNLAFNHAQLARRALTAWSDDVALAAFRAFQNTIGQNQKLTKQGSGADSARLAVNGGLL